MWGGDPCGRPGASSCPIKLNQLRRAYAHPFINQPTISRELPHYLRGRNSGRPQWFQPLALCTFGEAFPILVEHKSYMREAGDGKSLRLHRGWECHEPR